MSGEPSGGSRVMWSWGQLLMLPVSALAYSMEVMIRAFQELQRAAAQGLDALAPGVAPASRAAETQGGPVMDAASINLLGAVDAGRIDSSSGKERSPMADQDTDLSGEDRVKLVRYKIVFLKRECEVAFPEQEELVTYDTTGSDWGGIKVADFVSDLQSGNIQRPRRWVDADYPPEENGRRTIPEDDKKYIRVYFTVLQRWDREEAHYSKRQVEVLEDIRDALGGRRGRRRC